MHGKLLESKRRYFFSLKTSMAMAIPAVPLPLALLLPSSVTELNEACTQFKEKSAVHFPSLREQAFAFSL